MTRDETKKLLKEITVLFPRFMANAEDKTMKVDLWAEVLQKEEFKAMHDALVKYTQSSNNGFAPSAGQLIDIAVENIPFSEPYIDDEHPFLGWDQ